MANKSSCYDEESQHHALPPAPLRSHLELRRIIREAQKVKRNEVMLKKIKLTKERKYGQVKERKEEASEALPTNGERLRFQTTPHHTTQLDEKDKFACSAVLLCVLYFVRSGQE
eukprot:NODE_5510_length_670_cov_36.505636_g5134_i0.p2 GENE.NODE_5510_length_670_cov_36.505636_g5134_i0~~NODE_5510_length_670_cov_36.505636_g5134_i0.p2  ORF type:complete len:114 (+),score=11.04 NODE_5510_length_670_cov_36.505636_g5134_i0:168-509(+)